MKVAVLGRSSQFTVREHWAEQVFETTSIMHLVKLLGTGNPTIQAFRKLTFTAQIQAAGIFFRGFPAKRKSDSCTITVDSELEDLAHPSPFNRKRTVEP